jgi:hypothetical protein
MGWDADRVLARAGVACLTEQATAGKTWQAAHGKQGMITHPSRPPASPAPCQSPGPPLDVVDWRYCRLREAGFSPVLASTLARMRVDLHALLQLVDAGCPPELAARILAPLEATNELEAG